MSATKVIEFDQHLPILGVSQVGMPVIEKKEALTWCGTRNDGIQRTPHLRNPMKFWKIGGMQIQVTPPATHVWNFLGRRQAGRVHINELFSLLVVVRRNPHHSKLAEQPTAARDKDRRCLPRIDQFRGWLLTHSPSAKVRIWPKVVSTPKPEGAIRVPSFHRIQVIVSPVHPLRKADLYRAAP